MRRDTPTITVLMPVFNGEPYLREAVESILNQTWQDFEFVIINDGSTDGTEGVLRRYREIDERIHIHNQENSGVIASLNRGCRLARGKYIARMDADDVSLPVRLDRQVTLMERHPGVGVLGTWIEYIDGRGTTLGAWRMTAATGLIKWQLLFGTCLAHPSVMMRRDVIERVGYYRKEALHAEDYDLWARADNFTAIENLPEILLRRRVVKESIGSRFPAEQEASVVRVMQAKLGRLLGVEVPREMVVSLRTVIREPFGATLEQIEESARLIERLYRSLIHENTIGIDDAEAVARDVEKKIYLAAAAARRRSLWRGALIVLRALTVHPRLCLMVLASAGVKMKAGTV